MGTQVEYCANQGGNGEGCHSYLSLRCTCWVLEYAPTFTAFHAPLLSISSEILTTEGSQSELHARMQDTHTHKDTHTHTQKHKHTEGTTNGRSVRGVSTGRLTQADSDVRVNQWINQSREKTQDRTGLVVFVNVTRH